MSLRENHPLVYVCVLGVLLVVYMIAAAEYVSHITTKRLTDTFVAQMLEESESVALQIMTHNREEISRCHTGECRGADIQIDHFYKTKHNITFSGLAVLERRGSGVYFVSKVDKISAPNTLMLSRTNFTKVGEVDQSLHEAFDNPKVKYTIATSTVDWGNFFVVHVPLVNFFQDRPIKYLLYVEVPQAHLNAKLETVKLAKQAFIMISSIFIVLICAVWYGYLCFSTRTVREDEIA